MNGCNMCSQMRLIILSYQQAAQRLLDARYSGECDSNAIDKFTNEIDVLTKKYAKLNEE